MEMMAGSSSRGRRRRRSSVSDSEQQALGNDFEEVLEVNHDEQDSGILPSNGNGGPSADQDDPERPRRRKKLRRLTYQQNLILEGFFGICAHPDDSQRRHLSGATGLSMQQVKFWFQNKRTKEKNNLGKEDNFRLTVDNKDLMDENKWLKEAYKNALCPNCVGSPSHHQIYAEMERLRETNVFLKQQLSRLHVIIQASSSSSFQFGISAEGAIATQNETQMIAALAENAMREFGSLIDNNGPLWLPVHGGSLEILNEGAYAQECDITNIANLIGFRTEATRAKAVVLMDPKNVVEYLMDSECYGSFCPGILSSAKTIKVYSWRPTIPGNYDGAMHLMTTETVFPSPLVPSRKCTFLRCCKELPGGAMVIVDVSLDDGGGNSFKCCKMPSGVLIQPIKDNSCKVTAIEHVRVADTGLHELYQPCLPGLMFGARRWVESMARQSARMRALFHVNDNHSGNNGNRAVCSKSKKTLMKLADNMVVSYARSIASLPEGAWTTLCGSGTDQDIKVAHKRNDDGSNTSVVSVSASFHLPIPLRVTFDLLRNNVLRPKWDVLASGGSVREEVPVCKGIGAADSVSVVHVKPATGDQGNLMILQNSWYDVSGSFIVYAPVDSMLTNRIMGPGDVAEGELPLFPTGLALFPVGGTALQGRAPLGDDGETLVTVGFQILVTPAQTDLFSRTVQTALALMDDNIATIKGTLIKSHPIFYRSSGSAAPILN